MRVCVWGAGAVGGLLAGYASREGIDVIAVDANKAHVAAINHRGLQVIGADEFTARIHATTPDAIDETLDVVMLAVKSHLTVTSARAIAPLLSAGSVVVSLQNGVNPPILAQQIGQERTVGALVGVGGDNVSDGVVRLGSRDHFYVGTLGAVGMAEHRLSDVTKILSCLAPVSRVADIMSHLWMKQCVCSLLVATAVTDDPIATVIDNAIGRRIIAALLVESVLAVDALQIPLATYGYFDPALYRRNDRAEIDRHLQLFADHQRGSKKSHSGPWYDMAIRNQPTEIPYLTGELVRRSREAGVAVPLNQLLVSQIAEIETGRRARGWHNLIELDTMLSSPDSLSD